MAVIELKDFICRVDIAVIKLKDFICRVDMAVIELKDFICRVRRGTAGRVGGGILSDNREAS